ncbi:MAG: sigma-70 family RNA polymerase sigma factor [Candidatus Hydrogenedentales bacterium]|jgi:RNA polymerase sigma factor (sigma-70 family)
MSTNDLALLSRWTRDRDPEAFAEVARRHAGMVYGACRRVLGNAADAEDAAQECFLVLAQSSAPPKSNLAAWLHRVAVNKARDRARSDSQRRDREHRFASAHPTAAETEWHDVEALVDEAIAALPDDFREAIVAHFMEGHTHAEVAERLGVARSTVTHRVSKGVESIRESLKRRGIQIAAPSLVLGLTANMAEAAPPALVAAIGKLAVSGVPVASAGILAGLLTVKSALVAASVIAVGGVYVAFVQRPPSNPQDNATATNTPNVNVAQSDKSATAEAAARTAANPNANRSASGSAGDWRVLTGVIVDASGAPVKPQVDENGNATLNNIQIGSSSGRVGSSSTGVKADGTFVLKGHEPGAHGTVCAVNKTDNLASDFVDFSLTEGGAHHVTLQLLPGARVSGTFLDAGNLPIPNTMVHATSGKAEFKAGSPVDTSGNFDIGPLPPGRFMLTPASTDDSMQRFGLTAAVAEVTRGQHLSGVRLVFNKTRSVIAGTVVDSSGHGLPGVRVMAGALATGSSNSGHVKHSADTDAQGRFEMEAYAPQTFEMSVHKMLQNHEGSSSEQLPRVGERIRVEAGDRNVVLKVADYTVVQGRVVRADNGEPVPEFTVRATSNSGERPSQRIWRCKDGAFSFIHSGSPDVTIEVVALGLGSASQDVTLAKETSELVFRIAQEEGLRGRVVDSTGAPVQEVYLLKDTPQFLDDSYLKQEALAVTDAVGAFMLTGLPQSASTIFVASKGVAPVEIPIVRRGDWVVTLPEGSVLEGTVAVAGIPQSDQRVYVDLRPEYDSACSITLEGKTDAAGHYRLKGLVAGEANVNASVVTDDGRQGQRQVSKKVRVGDSGVTMLDFDVRPTDASISGHVYVAGKPVRAQVMVSTPDEAGSWSGHGGVSDPDGAYRVEGLWSGPARIDATLAETPPRAFTEELTLAPGDTKGHDIRFAEGSATLEGTIDVPESAQSHVSMSIEVAGSGAPERVELPNVAIKDNAYRIDGLPVGAATLSVAWSVDGSGQARRAYTVALAANKVTRQDIEVGYCSIRVEVNGATPGGMTWVMAYPGHVSAPDYRTMTMNDIERYNWETPPATMAMSLEKPLGPLPPGDYTIVVLDPGMGLQERRSANRSEDEPISGLRYAVGTVTATEDAEATVTLSLE